MSSTATTTNTTVATMHQTRQLQQLQSPHKMKQQQQLQQQQQQKLQEVQHYSDDPDKLLNEWLGELENLIGVSFLDRFSIFTFAFVHKIWVFTLSRPALDVLVPFNLSQRCRYTQNETNQQYLLTHSLIQCRKTYFFFVCSLIHDLTYYRQ